MIQLENTNLRISIQTLGAELCSVYNKQTQIEYMWQAGKEWPKHSPVLFPIVGMLKNNSYTFANISYSLPRHGFAREKEFTLIHKTETSATLRLQYDDATLAVYPFKFTLDLTYTITADSVEVAYSVSNVGENTMYFSLGAHPAFNVPLEPHKTFEDYELQFDSKITIHRWLLDNGLIAKSSKLLLQNESTLPLQSSLFEHDAIVCKGFDSETITIIDTAQKHGLEFTLNSCPFLGIWTAKNAPFLCIEPWHGIADSINSNKKLEEKEGFIPLKASQQWNYRWNIRVF